MNGVKKINPDSVMLDQADGQWAKYFALLLWKLAPDGVTITVKDIEQFTESESKYVLVHGHIDSIEFKLVTPDEALRLAEHDVTQRGSA